MSNFLRISPGKVMNRAETVEERKQRILEKATRLRDARESARCVESSELQCSPNPAFTTARLFATVGILSYWWRHLQRVF